MKRFRAWLVRLLYRRGGDKIQRRGIHAVAQAGRLRAVVKDVPQVRVASRAQHLGASHEKRAVGFGAHVLFGDRLIEAWPSGARLELGIRIEQRRGAADAPIQPFRVVLRDRKSTRLNSSHPSISRMPSSA